MQSGHKIGTRIFQSSSRNQIASHRPVLLSGLPDKTNRPEKFISFGCKNFRSAHQHGGMGIVSAGVHQSRLG